MIFHYGGTTGGHYNALVIRNGKWYICDDYIVREHNPVSKSEIKPNIVFYERVLHNKK